MALKTTPWESGSLTKLVPWEEDIILTIEETKFLLELQESERRAGGRKPTVESEAV